ncbi:MBL fold metallo-hydrolase [Shimia abyssi]|uniref:Glyoxylase-like metal-dependent hydrolase (Beta-lactamase superfamily II) n=1 Tax=Shimia abyssi TaxID=1662395 RepID=A0A2P8FKD2_9RHOB|nr:MBL fold metallo-hydrolase [Shimia abyssi]PSL22158.1 glyoxylase-like metal-dependent hydrolase (beta-lactamase superfamily II) [Shimia abyssi]
MLKAPALNRRHMLMGAAALPLAAATAKTASAAAEMKGVGMTRFNRMKLGDFEVTTLLVGTRTVEAPHSIFGKNVSQTEFAAVSEAANIPSDAAQFFFTPTVVNTGSELVLFDTGLSPDAMTAALTAAGYSNDQIDTVVVTHMHGDHIGGVAGDAGVTFAGARHVTGATEFDAWDKSGKNKAFEAKVRPHADKFDMIDPGASVASGITAVEAFGHTPGHMAYMIESNGKQLVIAADFANHYVYSLSHPDWEVKFDMDKAAAAATRKKMLGMMSADKIPFVGYHMPWPGVGYVENHDGAFKYAPASYQLMLG